MCPQQKCIIYTDKKKNDCKGQEPIFSCFICDFEDKRVT